MYIDKNTVKAWLESLSDEDLLTLKAQIEERLKENGSNSDNRNNSPI